MDIAPGASYPWPEPLNGPEIPDMKPGCFPILALLVLGAAPARAQEVSGIADLSLEALGSVRVSGVSKVEESLASAPASVTVYRTEDFDRFGWRTVSELVDAAPGMLLTSSALVRFAPAIRGDIRATSGVHVLILLDGRPLRSSLDALTSQDVFAAIPLAALDRVELIRGPGSVLYGTNAFAGVINLVTRSSRQASATLDGSVGSLNSYSALAEGTAHAGGASFSLTGQLLRAPDLDRSVEDESSRTTSASLDGKSGVVIGSVRSGGFALQGLYTRWEGGTLLPFLPGLPVAEFNSDEFFLGASYQGKLAPSLEGRFDLDYMRGRAGAALIDTRPKSDDLLLEGTLFYHPAPRWHFLAGGTANLLTGSAVYFGMQALDYNQWNGSGYAQGEFWPSPRWRLVLGAQAVKTPDIPVQVVPRAAVVFGGLHGFGVKLLYGEAFRSASPAETQIDAPGLAEGNPTLLPERMHTGELITSWQGTRGSVALNLFASEERDLITTTPLPGGGATYQNQGKFSARGAELEGTVVPGAGLTLLGSVSYQTNRLNDQYDDVGKSPQWLVRAGASWSPGPVLTLSLFDNWLGATPKATVLFASAPEVNPANQAYHLVSARATVGLGRLFHMDPATSLSLRLGVDNLLDEETWYPDATFGTVNTLPWRPGRVFTAGVRLNWSER